MKLIIKKIMIIIIIMIFNLECTSSHPKDNSCELSLQSDKTIFLNYHGYHGNGGRIFYHKCTTTHPKSIQMKFHYNIFYLSWLPWQSSRVTVNIIIIIIIIIITIIIIIIIKFIINGVKPCLGDILNMSEI
jgi:hypothetical protein